jgi:hypothetical protein
MARVALDHELRGALVIVLTARSFGFNPSGGQLLTEQLLILLEI